MSKMGPRAPLPVELGPRLSIDHLLWVANTRHGPGGHWFARVVEDREDHDHLRDVEDGIDYLARHHVPVPATAPTPRHLRELEAIREMVRGLLEPDRPAWTPAVRSILANRSFGIDVEDGATVRAEGAGWDGFVGDLMLPLVRLVEMRSSLKICGNPHCRLVFLDASKAGSRRWCDSGGCGNRVRVGRYRTSRRG